MNITREQILAKRAEYLSNNSRAFKGNTIARTEYIKYMINNGYKLSDYQKSLTIGLLLSDASFDASRTVARLKIQQRTAHKPWLINVKKSLLEFTASDEDMGQTAVSRDMIELDTLKCPYFHELLPYFHSEDAINSGNLGVKGIMPSIKPWINPVTVANWFCGDGGRADYTPNAGKGITFHTQGFNNQECQILCDALGENLGIEASVKIDSRNPLKYRIDTAGPSYDRFVELVGPFIDPCFKGKLPTPRAERSRWGNMTSDRFNSIVSSKLIIPDVVKNWNRFETQS